MPNEEMSAHLDGQHGGQRGFLGTKIGRLVIVVVLAVAVAAAVVVAVVSQVPNTDQSADQLPSHTPDILPTQTAKPEVTNTPEKMPASLEVYKSMSLEEFAALPKQEQQPYIKWLVYSIGGMKKFADEYHAAEPSPGDSHNILPSGEQSLENTGQEAITYATYAMRIALALEGLDAQKALVAAFDDPTGADAERYNGLVGTLAALNGGGLKAWMQGAKNDIPMDAIDTESDNNVGANGFQGKDVTAHNPVTGGTGSGRITFIPYTDPVTGQPTGQWLI